MNEIQKLSIYPITTEIIFLNTFLDNTKNFNSTIKSKKIQKNKPNSNDLKNLAKLKSDKIVLNHMVQEVSDELKELHLINFEEFIKYISKEIKDILHSYIRFYTIETGEKYFANVF